MKVSQLNYKQRIITFIDILGFKEIIKQSEKDTTKIDLIYSVLDFLKTWEAPEKWGWKFVEIEEDAQKKGITDFDIRGRTNTTAFSDSIVISVKIDNNINEMMSTLVVTLGYIGAILLEKGILFRGGITYGNVIHKENGIVFGQGLIDAYLLEMKSARYPRLILSDKLIKKLNYPLEEKRNRYPYHQYIERFEDGCVGFHQMMYYQVLQSWTEMTQESLVKSLDSIRKTIIAGLDDSFEHPDVFEKYNWMKEQYNKLIIFDDFNFETKTEEYVKMKIRPLNENIAGQNIHYSYTDNFYEKKRSRSGELGKSDNTYTKAKKQQEHKNAYERWSTEDNEKLELLFCQGKTIKELSVIFARNEGAIESRIKKLELREKYER